MSDIQPDPYIDTVAAEHGSEHECEWCRECGACDKGLPVACTCGDCTCVEYCGHKHCGDDSSAPVYEPPLLATAVPDGMLARGVSAAASWAGE